MIIHGDSLEKLKDLESDSVDLLCTDPPYGYSFMGKSWDKTLPDIGIFKECFRVLKPGAFAFVMSAPRSDVCARMMLMLEDAGFEIGFTPIYWTYASGFPKAMNIGKMVDKREGVEVKEGVGFRTAGEYGGRNLTDPTPQGEARDAMRHKVQSEAGKALDGSYGGFQPKPAVEVVIVAMKPLSEKTYVDQALKNGKGITWLDDCRVPSGGHTYAPKGIRPGAHNIVGDDWKPDNEEVTSAGRFPANLLVEDNVLGDHSRFFSLDEWANTMPFLAVPKAAKSEKNAGLGGTLTVKYNVGISPNKQACKDATTVAVRLLERVISDTAPVSFSIGESGASITAQFLPASSSIIKTTTSKIIESKILNSLTHSLTSESTADANSEMESGGSPAESVASLREWLLTITNGATELARGASDAAFQMLSLINDEGEWKPTSNIHSTVKPLTLMSYLITLGSRPGDVVLDPFLGSGTTAIAAKQLGRECIGIEREEEYVRIAEARLAAVNPTLL